MKSTKTQLIDEGFSRRFLWRFEFIPEVKAKPFWHSWSSPCTTRTILPSMVPSDIKY